jgi:hypothetical protein
MFLAMEPSFPGPLPLHAPETSMLTTGPDGGTQPVGLNGTRRPPIGGKDGERQRQAAARPKSYPEKQAAPLAGAPPRSTSCLATKRAPSLSVRLTALFLAA